MSEEKQFTMHFGGGCLFVKCHKCHKEIGAEEVNFPGTPEQQIEPRRKLKEKEEKHICTPEEYLELRERIQKFE